MPLEGWDANGVMAEANREMVRRMTAATVVVRNHARELLSIAGTGTRAQMKSSIKRAQKKAALQKVRGQVQAHNRANTLAFKTKLVKRSWLKKGLITRKRAWVTKGGKFSLAPRRRPKRG